MYDFLVEVMLVGGGDEGVVYGCFYCFGGEVE